MIVNDNPEVKGETDLRDRPHSGVTLLGFMPNGTTDSFAPDMFTLSKLKTRLLQLRLHLKMNDAFLQLNKTTHHSS